jgi:hypothetical protein
VRVAFFDSGLGKEKFGDDAIELMETSLERRLLNTGVWIIEGSLGFYDGPWI